MLLPFSIYLLQRARNSRTCTGQCLTSFRGKSIRGEIGWVGGKSAPPSLLRGEGRRRVNRRITEPSGRWNWKIKFGEEEEEKGGGRDSCVLTARKKLFSFATNRLAEDKFFLNFNVEWEGNAGGNREMEKLAAKSLLSFLPFDPSLRAR